MRRTSWMAACLAAGSLVVLGPPQAMADAWSCSHDTSGQICVHYNESKSRWEGKFVNDRGKVNTVKVYLEAHNGASGYLDLDVTGWNTVQVGDSSPLATYNSGSPGTCDHPDYWVSTEVAYQNGNISWSPHDCQ